MNIGKKNRFALILALLFLVYAIGFSIYFKGRGGEIPIWFVGTLLLAPMIIFVRGLISFIVQMSRGQAVVCANCGETIQKKSKYLTKCPNCQQSLYAKNQSAGN